MLNIYGFMTLKLLMHGILAKNFKTITVFSLVLKTIRHSSVWSKHQKANKGRREKQLLCWSKVYSLRKLYLRVACSIVTFSELHARKFPSDLTLPVTIMNRPIQFAFFVALAISAIQVKTFGLDKITPKWISGTWCHILPHLDRLTN